MLQVHHVDHLVANNMSDIHAFVAHVYTHTCDLLELT